MEMMLEDVWELYQIKCRKYKPEKLTERLKDILFREAVNEVQFMNYIDSFGGAKCSTR